MKVTGWTTWGNKKFIDVAEELTQLRIAAAKDVEPQIPSREEAAKMSSQDLEIIFKERDEAFDKAFGSEAIIQLNELFGKLYEIVLEDVREHGYHFTGSDHQNADWGTPIIDDKYILALSQRQWGRLIAEAFPDEIDNSDGRGYCEWAWITHDKDLVKIPISILWRE